MLQQGRLLLDLKNPVISCPNRPIYEHCLAQERRDADLRRLKSRQISAGFASQLDEEAGRLTKHNRGI